MLHGSARQRRIEAAAEEEAKQKKTLIQQYAEEQEQREKDGPLDQKMIAVNEEKDLLKSLQERQSRLASVHELSKDIIYTDPMTSSWIPPRYLREMPEDERNKLRSKYNILTDGENIPPPVIRFIDFKLPQPIMNIMKKKKIMRPTPIQIQALSCALAGRDLIGIAYTGSGKTLVFALPAIMQALEEELQMPVIPSEGPFSLILCPSRELANQTFEVISEFAEGLRKADYPQLRVSLCIGGITLNMELIKQGPHIVVATPGRLLSCLKRKDFTLEFCKLVCLDEADRMFDLTFEEDVRNIFNFFKRQRQTLLFSATMPRKVQDFIKNSLVKPIIVNTGRTGAANMDVIQEVELVKQEAKMVYLLQVLQKTAPPVLIFCENKQDVDNINEYLLRKGVLSCSIHGGKEQKDREDAIKDFKAGKKDVLVATDVASKGLDFPDIQHVINYDMPREIENYIHRIGRTGRSNRTGVATTFINKTCTDSILLDLKHLLIESKQSIPPVLMSIPDPFDSFAVVDGTIGCAFCGGLGHRVIDCPKLAQNSRKAITATGHEDQKSGGGSDW
ncbi:MAG: putative DEAD-box ATP-dependent RNA helicase 35 [Streblomastix strix]|uniref:RNA helicase n=1 Tax=Streblomastix strix TaxID=222440 RepID=A0A5J4WHA8_9EUKA|nr:MAG: putative DEAD-box ATP-dependent RNA helicase 35 [Streblomastix strix]